MKTIPRDTPRPTKPLTELMSAANGGSVTTCPACGQPRAFHVTNSYLKTNARTRLRQCRFCGHAQDELVPPPVITSETSVSVD
jgi:uncharacterized protein (DUF983 family)